MKKIISFFLIVFFSGSFCRGQISGGKILILKSGERIEADTLKDLFDDTLVYSSRSKNYYILLDSLTEYKYARSSERIKYNIGGGLILGFILGYSIFVDEDEALFQSKSLTKVLTTTVAVGAAGAVYALLQKDTANYDFKNKTLWDKQKYFQKELKKNSDLNNKP